MRKSRTVTVSAISSLRWIATCSSQDLQHAAHQSQELIIAGPEAEEEGAPGWLRPKANYDFSIHAKYAEGVNEIRPSVATPIGNAHIKCDWIRPCPGNLEAVVILRDVSESRQAVDAR